MNCLLAVFSEINVPSIPRHTVDYSLSSLDFVKSLASSRLATGLLAKRRDARLEVVDFCYVTYHPTYPGVTEGFEELGKSDRISRFPILDLQVAGGVFRRSRPPILRVRAFR